VPETRSCNFNYLRAQIGDPAIVRRSTTPDTDAIRARTRQCPGAPGTACHTPRAMERVSVRCDDGWILRGERRRHPDASAVIVCGHAMMVDRRTLDRPRGQGLASTLHAHGFDVLTMDARGHGESGPRAIDGARWTYDDIVHHDVPSMVRLGRDIAHGRPVILLGHSLVGHAAMIAAGLGRDAPDAIVGYAPNLWAPKLEPSAAARVAKAALVRSWTTLTRARGFFDAVALGVGTDGEAAPYVAQFASMWERDRLTSPDGRIDYEDALARATSPILAYSSERDRLLARPASVSAFLARMVRARVEHRVLRGPDAPDHMGFTKHRATWEQTCQWIRNLL
jgi:predicted alpha/beta hydrolase